MITPGLAINANGAFEATISSAQAAQAIQQGLGIMNDASIPIDSGTPAGAVYRAGVRLNASGAPYGTTTTDSSDVYVGGLRITTAGALVYEVGAPTGFQNGNPHTESGALAVAT